MDAEGLAINKEIQPIMPLLRKIQLKYRQQAQDLELNIDLLPNINEDDLWNYDADRIDQVLTNLIDNATRYTHPGDSITITANKDSQYQILNIKTQVAALLPNILIMYLIVFIK